MKNFLTLLFLLSACVGIPQAQSYPAPDQRKSYSVLALGQSLKVAVANEGVFKIRYEDLAQKGLLSQAVPSYKVALYGNSAGMLPFFNISGIYDDLSPLPIQMIDGGDGMFGPGDYFLFYGQSPHRWSYDETSRRFSYTRHHFSDSTFYFVSLNAEMEHRIGNGTATDNSDIVLTSFPEHIRHENDLVNLANGGLDWFGESFTFSGNTRTISLSTPSPVAGQKGFLSVVTQAQSIGGTATFLIQLNRKSLRNHHSAIGSGTAFHTASVSDSVPIETENSTIEFTFTKTGSTSNGYLDHISLIYERQLTLKSACLFFRHPQAIDHKVSFRLEAASTTEIWDITDVYHITSIPSKQNGGRMEFSSTPDNSLHEYVAFSAADCPAPTFCQIVQPQNLHELKDIEYVVVTHPLFLEQAGEVAGMHRERDGYSTFVATTEQVYNEFSSGAKDPSAIRLFLRHLGIRSDSSHQPRHLLLFGAASFDYKSVLGNLTDFVPTLQSVGTSSEGGNDPLEDNFGYIADNAGINPDGLGTRGVLQVAVGRLPVRSVTEARNMVEKIDIYSSPHYVADPGQPNLSGNFGNWRNEVVFVTDDGFETRMENDIIRQDYIQKNLPYIHINKLYSDNYERASSSTSTRVPALENDIRSFVENGCLFLGYEGHSGWDAWSDERILTNAIVESWKTTYTYPVIFASSCTFAFFDQINQVSGAELAILKPHGGAIATIASTRTAATGQIEDIQRCFVERFIDKTDGNIHSIGEAFLYAKTTANHSHRQKFILLGDPGLKAAVPKNNVQTLHVNGKPVNSTDADTLKALSPVTIEGRITDMNGDAMNHFNGTLIVKVFDKAVKKQTLGLYDPRSSSINPYNPKVEYTDQNSLIFQGQTEVRDGSFSFSFIVPKDIQYNYGNGRINYYAYNEENDANGSFDGIVIGGINPDAVLDTTAPMVDLYIGKNTFAGGTVGIEPALYAEISDEYGINTTGAGIGHDMTLIIDNDYKNAITVNDYFRYNTGSYKEGTLIYPMDLSPGKHSAKLKVWNINNVSTTKEIVFNVNDSERLKIFNLRVSPNPARGEYVDFYFNHNSQNGGIEKCTLSIFNLQGAKIASFEYKQSDLSGYTVGPLRWNLCGNGNQRVQAGMYFCHIKAKDTKGNVVRQGIKLIVVN